MKVHPFIQMLALVLGALLSFGFAASAQNATPRYQLTDLGALPGFPYSRAYGINNEGQVVGQVARLEPKIETHAVLWDGDKVLDISVPEGVTYGAALGVNDKGQVVGGSQLDSYGSRGFRFMGLPEQAYLWQQEKTSALSANSSQATAINNRGQVVGRVKEQATLWEQGQSAALATPAGIWSSSASAINNQGQVVGVVIKEGRRLGALWSEGQMQLIGTLPGDDQSIVTAINDKGQVVGSSGKNNSYWNLPFLWENGKIRMLAPLDGRTWHNQVLGINNKGQAVGCGTQQGVYMHAVLWEDDFPLDLNDLISPGSGLVLMKATAINDLGQIAGEARNPKGENHAFLLTPTVTPSTITTP